MYIIDLLHEIIFDLNSVRVCVRIFSTYPPSNFIVYYTTGTELKTTYRGKMFKSFHL